MWALWVRTNTRNHHGSLSSGRKKKDRLDPPGSSRHKRREAMLNGLEGKSLIGTVQLTPSFACRRRIAAIILSYSPI